MQRQGSGVHGFGSLALPRSRFRILLSPSQVGGKDQSTRVTNGEDPPPLPHSVGKPSVWSLSSHSSAYTVCFFSVKQGQMYPLLTRMKLAPDNEGLANSANHIAQCSQHGN